jgi:exopolysaccharide production protein ExoZ
VSLASTSIAGLLPATPPLLLVTVTTSIVVALGLLLNILVERPLLKLSRTSRLNQAALLPKET